MQDVTTLSLRFRGRPGSPNPLTGNRACPLYVRVSDTMGRRAVVSHPDPEAVLIDKWTRWQIPLTQFAGVDVDHLKEVAMGVGGRRRMTPVQYTLTIFASAERQIPSATEA